MLKRLVKKPLTWAVVAVLAVGGAFGLYWFQPWKIAVDRTVNETVPVAAPAASAGPTRSPGPTTGAGPTASAVPPPVDTVLATGSFVSHEHATSGTAKVVRLADGRRVVVLENLDTSNGPDVWVWLTGANPKEQYAELARLKGNKGNQVYDVPTGVDTTAYTHVSIWCKRFSVSFGAAELRTS